MKTLHHTLTLKNVQPVKTVRADVVFGSPSKRCVGIGICQVNPRDVSNSTLQTPCCQRVDTSISLDGADRLTFRFSREKICKKLISKQFAFSRFRITDALEMPGWLMDQLEMAAASLVPGVYPVHFSEDAIEVSIKIKVDYLK